MKSSPHPHSYVIENKEQKDETDGSDSDGTTDSVKKSPDDNRCDRSLHQDLMPKCSLERPGLKWENSVPVQCTEDWCRRDTTSEINVCKDKAAGPQRSQVHACVQDDVDLPHSISEAPLSEGSDRHPHKGPRMKVKVECIDDTRKKKIADEVELSLKYITAGKRTTKKWVKPFPVDSVESSVLDIMPFLKPVSRNKMYSVYMLRSFSPHVSSPSTGQCNQGESCSSNYSSDLTRLATFIGYPPDIKIFAIVLSRDGFIFLQSEQSIECYSCQLRIPLSELRKPDADPVRMHGDQSPQCPLKQREGSENAAVTKQIVNESGSPSGSTANTSSGPNPSSVLNETRGSGAHQNGASAVPSSPVQSPPTLNTTLDSISRTLQEAMPRFIDGSIQHPEKTGTTTASLQRSESAAAAVETTDSSGSRASTDRSRPSGSPPTASHAGSEQAGALASAAGNQTRNPKATKKTKAMKRAEAAARQASANSGAGATGASQTSGKKGEQGKEKKKLTYGDLGIFAEKPKRPDLASLQKRLATYDGKWQDSFAKTPQTLAECGMYYAGYNDCARCFFCAGGLKNWESEDEPWIEHARWFAKCPYLLLCKGQPFVDIVQRKHDKNEKIVMKDVEEEIKQKTRSMEESSSSLPVGPSGHEPRQRRSHSERNSTNSSVEVLRKLEKENEDLNSDLACKICMDERSTVVFLPCGHMVACTDCAVVLKTCPLCRADIRGTVKAQLEC